MKPTHLSPTTSGLFVSSQISEAIGTNLHVTARSGLDFRRFVTEALSRETGEALLSLCSSPHTGFLESGEHMTHEVRLLPARDNQCRLLLSVKPQDDAPPAVRSAFLKAALTSENEGCSIRDAFKSCDLTYRNTAPILGGTRMILDAPDGFDELTHAHAINGDMPVIPRFLESETRDIKVSSARSFHQPFTLSYDVIVPTDAFTKFEAVKEERRKNAAEVMYPVSDMYHIAYDAIHRDLGIPSQSKDRFFFNRDVVKTGLSKLFPHKMTGGIALDEMQGVNALTAAIQDQHPHLSADDRDAVRNILLLERYIAHYSKLYGTVEAGDVFNRIVTVTGMERLAETAKTLTAADCKRGLDATMNSRVTHKERTEGEKFTHKSHDI